MKLVARIARVIIEAFAMVGPYCPSSLWPSTRGIRGGAGPAESESGQGGHP